MSEPAKSRDWDKAPIASASQPMRLGLVGRGITLSRTPRMHEAEARAQGLACHYALLDTDRGAAGSLADVIDRAEQSAFAGLNVTYPYKQDVVALLDTLSDAAERVGAVNTVVFKDGRRHGDNTDLWGFVQNIQNGLPDAAMGTVLLIGAGGAGNAVAHALRDLGALKILVADVREGAAQALCKAVGRESEAVPMERLAGAAAAADGIVNATPVGTAELPGTPMDPAFLQPRHWVSDIVYFPLQTALLAAARAAGCDTLSGEGMAVFQAVRAFELFTGRPADAGRMRATFRAAGPA
ncbi:shikimate dehydrogenase [Acuticoccus sp. MNP-M23]|uniref:shikimate dehydrogenase n=1 Tax=Acuticoccus sp. MNP-M23 TaxID=3072793 RepID=UPI0028166565|nr:shikimate dehydrogenase [Acuticoccus sp. MNP-M23]WMS40909.1 shikimate dehydrogenase [Acuticoccus sp. MNP-M23]